MSLPKEAMPKRLPDGLQAIPQHLYKILGKLRRKLQSGFGMLKPSNQGWLK